MNDLTHLSLFTGIGGIDLAAEWAGFRTIGQVEQNKYALRILRKRFGRTLPRWTDIRDLSADDVRRRTGIDCPTLISGGFPCQPFSCAGKRRGKEDDRYLWPEMFRIVRELRPAWVLGENVAGIVNMELESCCADLEGEGYQVRALLVPACGVGAPHYRNRIFLVAHTNDRGSEKTNPLSLPHRGDIEPRGNVGCGSGGQSFREPKEIMANNERIGRSRDWQITTKERQTDSGTTVFKGSRNVEPVVNREIQWWPEPAVGRVAHGVPRRVDRLRCLGNAVVPQQVYPILAGIAQVEHEINKG